MPEISFPSEWLKIGENVQEGDLIVFQDAGELDPDSDRWNFSVSIKRNGTVVDTKKFTLNKTNFKAVKALYGSNSDVWPGKEMRVAKIKVRNPRDGSLVDSIALEAPVGITPPAPV